jgi:hypothetical protein
MKRRREEEEKRAAQEAEVSVRFLHIPWFVI